MRDTVGSTSFVPRSGQSGNDFGDTKLQEVKRDIPAGYYIRPIPQQQLDGMEMTADEKANYQNPAYRN